MKKIAFFALFVIVMVFSTAVIIAVTAQNAKAEEKLPNKKLHQYEFQNKSYKIHCEDQKPGGCENARRHLELLQQELDAIRKRNDEQLKSGGLRA